jgi:voltage-gated potassium channel
MAWLGVLFALLVGFDVAVDPEPEVAALEISTWVIWGIFALEFFAKLWLAPSRRSYLRKHWWQPIFLLLPFLRVFSFLRLARLGRALPASRVISSSYRIAGTARFLLRSRLLYLGALSSVGVLAVAQMAYLFEREVSNPVFDSFGEAVLWSLATVLALQGDPVPSSLGAELVMILGFILGLVLIASLAGVIGSFLVDAGQERRAEHD